jgi:hypothetical protein
VDQIVENFSVAPNVKIEKRFDSFSIDPKTLASLL